MSWVYTIDSYDLEEVKSFVDLGVLLDQKLRFNLHIESIVNKAYSMLGFIKRWSKEFNDPYITKTLFESLVRPILEYSCIVWSPYYNTHIDRIESVQKQFLLFALRGLGWNQFENLPPYENRLKLIDLATLERRRYMLKSMFIIKLLNGQIDSIFLLNRLNLNIPSRFTRNFRPLKLTITRSNYDFYNPFRALCSLYNDLSVYLPFLEPLHKVKKYIIYELSYAMVASCRHHQST